MASTSSDNSDNDSQHRHHKKKDKNHKKTKKRYRPKSDDEEKGYKKFKRKKEKKVKKNRNDEKSESEEKSSPKVIPSDRVESEPKPDDSESPDGDCYGPALPPHLRNKPIVPPTPQNIGPQLPPHLLQKQIVQQESPPPSSSSSSNDDKDEDDEDLGVGPLPGVTNVALEQRALEIKLGKVSKSGEDLSSEQQKAREEWMMELPEVKTVTDLGLGARQFRTKERPDFSDRSSWTDTPQDRDKKKTKPPTEKDLKKQQELELQQKLIRDRDAHQEKVAKEHKKKHKRDKSLYDLHQDKLKKAKKDKEDEPQTRRPFDRNVDLQANRFDEAQKKAVIKKAQLLDSRFSSGSSKYL